MRCEQRYPGLANQICAPLEEPVEQETITLEDLVAQRGSGPVLELVLGFDAEE